ncbi:hypothetical protein BC835DRAFT_1419648 [Cytidiella melzeri]|nr:hypothetical protein BC835DRAFT_1419648 [Cytidiella melzeri]
MFTPEAPAPPSLEEVLEAMGVDLTLGTTIVSVDGCTVGFIIAMLYGITSVQTYIYFNNSPRDGTYMKATMFVLWVIDTLGAIFSSHVAYTYCVKALLNPVLWTTIVWSDGVNFMLLSLSDVIVTGIFAYRIWKLGGKVWPLVFIVPPAIVVFVGGQGLGITTLVTPSFNELREHIAWLYYAVFSLQALSDITIMVSLCTILLQQRTRVQRTRTVVGMLIFYSVNTCLLTCSVGVAALITNALSPNTFFWQGLSATLPKLMLNSLLALLNSREGMRNKMKADGPLSIHLSRLDSPSIGSGRRTAAALRSNDSCSTHTDVQVIAGGAYKEAMIAREEDDMRKD